MTVMLQSGLSPERRYSNMVVLTSHSGKAACTAPAPCRGSMPGEVTCFRFELELTPAGGALVSKRGQPDRLCRLAGPDRVRALVVRQDQRTDGDRDVDWRTERARP